MASYQKKINTWIIVFFILFFSVSLRLWNLNEMGRTWDEGAYVEMGYMFIELIKNRDFSSDYWYKTSDAPPLARYLYGLAGQFDIKNFTLKEPVFHYDYTHARFISILFSSLTVLLVFFIGKRYVSMSVGFYASIILCMMPLFMGYSQLATLESMISFFFTASIYAYVRFLEDFSSRRMVLCGILTGLALLTKYTNALLLPLMLLLYYLHNRSVHKRRDKHVSNFFHRFLIICVISFVVIFVLWPMPWFHLKEVIEPNYSWRILGSMYSVPEVFFGKLVLVPHMYYIVYFLITTPLFLLLLFLIGLKRINLKKRWILYAILTWFLFPFIQSFYNFRQHGIRYIIEMYVPFSLIAAIGFDWLISKSTKKIQYKIIFLTSLILYLFIALWRITPYYLDYFNGLVGGTKRVYERRMFQLGWWGQGIKEAALFVGKNAPGGSRIGIALSPSHVMPPLPNYVVTTYTPTEMYDYVIINYYNVLREGFDDKEVKRDYNPVYEVDADGAKLVTVYKHK